MLGLTVTMTGADEFQSALGRVVADLPDLTELWEELEPKFYEVEKRLFDSRGGSAGATWPDLSPAYAARKSITHPGKTILVREGDLQASLTEQGAASQVRRITATEMTLGTSIAYAGAHHEGAGVPKREVIHITPADVDDFAKAGESWLDGRLKKLGL